MPWPSGSMPVMNVDQATGLCGGVAVPSGLKDPSRRRRSRWGSALQCCWTNCGSMPSTPSTMTRGIFFCEPEMPQAARNASGKSEKKRKRFSGGSRKTENRFPFHPGRRLHAEQLERRGRHILDAGILRIHFAIRKEHAGNQQRVDAVIAAPGFGVVLEHTRADF